MSVNQNQPTHFQGKEAIGHVVSAQASGLIDSAEVHGTEVPGYINAGADAAREISLSLLLLFILLIAIKPHTELQPLFFFLLIYAIGWTIWKTGRSAWLGWARLERLHRVLAQERWEIQHHRQQERSELKELYAAKGFEGKLLEDVLDVLMADDNRLLRVMVEEEMGLSLESHDHPLKQALGAFLGCFLASAICLLGFFLFSSYGIALSAMMMIGLSGAILSKQADNQILPAVIWSIGLGALAFSSVYFLLQYFLFPSFSL